MKKTIIYIFTVILSVALGAGGMYVLMNYFPNTIVETVNKNEVTVTDKGISYGVNNVKDAVVVIKVYNGNKLSGFGSGFAYKIKDNVGYIMTNHHVIEGNGTIKVVFPNSEEEIDATVVGSDEYADIAVLQIDSKYVTKVANLGNSEEINVGDTVFTIGVPIDVNYAGTVTRGILSGKNRLVSVSTGESSVNDWIMNVMQTDASINPGNSGGPLCNVNGEVIGINSLKIVEDEVEGLGFSIPIEDALYYAEKIISGERIVRPYIGISMIDASSSYALMLEGIRMDDVTEGVVISSVENGSPADKSGLKRGDIIQAIKDNKTNNIAEFRYYLYKNEPGEKVEITIYRDGKQQKVEVTLSSLEN